MNQLTEAGTLYTLGYTQTDAGKRLERILRQHEQVLLMDIRLSPHSRWFPEWNRQVLSTRYDTYCWEQRLGNVNYRRCELGIKLAHGHEQAIERIVSHLMAGTSVILLCGCANEQTCHRLVVAQMVQQALATQQPSTPLCRQEVRP